MEEASYLGISEIKAADLTTCGSGLFQSFRSGSFGNVLVTKMGITRYNIYLDNPKGAMFVEAPEGQGSSRVGILWPNPAIEVDPSTLYNPDHEGEALGDLILSSQPMIYARPPEGWFDDGERIKLWGENEEPAKSVGFRAWRLVSVVGERRRVIFNKKSNHSNQPG